MLPYHYCLFRRLLTVEPEVRGEVIQMELQPAIAMFKDRGFLWARKYWSWRLVVAAICLWYFEHLSVAAPLGQMWAMIVSPFLPVSDPVSKLSLLLGASNPCKRYAIVAEKKVNASPRSGFFHRTTAIIDQQ